MNMEHIEKIHHRMEYLGYNQPDIFHNIVPSIVLDRHIALSSSLALGLDSFEMPKLVVF